nr:putative ribonuclease h protein [Quercus suber]
MSGVGGVARSATGKWLWGFSLHLGVTNNTMAELWGIREMLLRAWDNGHCRLCFQTDSLLASKWLNTNEVSNLILDCRWLLNRGWEARVKHIWREANSCADLLAKRGAS